MPRKITIAEARGIARGIQEEADKRRAAYAEEEVRRTTDVEGHCAMATGSLPVSSAEVILQKWAQHRNYAAHEKHRAAIGSIQRHAWKERENLIAEMLHDMGRLAGLPIPRQPEENIPREPDAQN